MELRVGYKNTEVGIIPEDWEIKTIAEISKPVRGGSPRPAGDPKFFNGDFISWLTVAALTNIPESQLYVNETGSKLTKEGANYSRILEIGTVIIANSGFSLGISKILDIKCCANDGIAALLDFDDNLDKEFVTYYLNTLTEKLRKVIAIGNDQPNLNKERIGKIAIPVPTKSEQIAIAKSLSDIDILINSLEKFISKKRNIKQGAMQKLLQPKEHWEVKRMADIITKKPKTLHQSSFGLKEGKYPFFTNSSNNKLDKYFNHFDFDDEVIVANTGGVAFFKYFKGKFAAMSDCFVFSTKEDTKYIYYFLKNIEMVVNENGFTGSGIKHLDKKYFNEIRVIIPNIEEQIRIANILSDMDNEITALETKLDKYRKVKSGMVQNLLTGKIRLV
jgi:type I restriction enzyme S subunit